MANPIPAEKLTEGRTVIVRGQIQYSHVMSMIDGEELTRSIQQQRNSGAMYITDKPHTRIVLENAQVIYADPSNPTLEEQHVQHKLYTSKKNPGVVSFSHNNKSPFLPPVWAPKDPADLSQGYDQITDPEGELDNGLNVSLVLGIFKAGDNPKRGIGLDAVIVHEPVRYYSNSNIDRNQLAAMGIVLNSNPVTPSYNVQPAAAQGGAGTGAQEGGAPAQNNQYTQNGLPTPGIGATGGAPAQGAGQGQAPQQQNQQFQGQPQQAPAQPQYQPQQAQPQAGQFQQPAQPALNQTPFDPNAAAGNQQFQGQAAPQQQQAPAFDPNTSDPWAPVGGDNQAQPGINFG